MKIRVFTDGACMRNGQVGARASYACWFPENKEISEANVVPDTDPQTNNRGELMGIKRAIEILLEKFDPNELDVHIYTDSQYSKNCLTVWLPGFIERNWKTSGYKGGSSSDVKNRDLIEETSGLLTRFKSYIISYVAAHTGGTDDLSKQNDIVDRMAVSVLNPEVADMKVIRTNTEIAIDGLPVELMGPPANEDVLIDWCKKNIDKLDQDTLGSALITVLSKTLKKNGFILDKQRLHKRSIYRLTANNLIAEGSKLIKEE